jgi:hypothetical protein
VIQLLERWAEPLGQLDEPRLLRRLHPDKPSRHPAPQDLVFRLEELDLADQLVLGAAGQQAARAAWAESSTLGIELPSRWACRAR